MPDRDPNANYKSAVHRRTSAPLHHTVSREGQETGNGIDGVRRACDAHTMHRQAEAGIAAHRRTSAPLHRTVSCVVQSVDPEGQEKGRWYRPRV